MKILYLIHYITVIYILCSFGVAQNYITEEIPNPYSNITNAELYSGKDNSLHIIGISDSLSDEAYVTHSLSLFITTRNANGFANGYTVIDTGYTFSAMFSGSDDVFNLSVAENLSGKLLVGWTKQYTAWTDVINYPRYFEAPVLKLGFWYENTFNILQEYKNEEYQQLKSDAENNFHLVRQSVTPLHYHTEPDSNYYFTSSKIIYNKIHSDGTIDSTLNIGNGFLPHIHVDKNGNVHFLWLAADSSNSKFFRLMYMQKTTAGFSPAITIKDSVHGQWDEYNVHDFPIDYFSFVDDSGKVYVGWTDNNDFYDGIIFFATISSNEKIRIDSLGNLRLWGSQATFKTSHSGKIHALWQTYGDGWDFHYSQGSSTDSLFSFIRTYDSLYKYLHDPVIHVNKNNSADGLFNQYNGIGYFQDLYKGKDTLLIISKGSLAYGLNTYRLPRTNANSFVTDQSGQMWLLSSRNSENTKLVKFDLLPTGLETKKIFPENFSLSQNYPNPFNPVTKIKYSVPFSTFISLKVYNLLGQEVATLFEGEQKAGTHTVLFDGSGLASGVYYYRLETNDFAKTRKLLLLK